VIRLGPQIRIRIALLDRNRIVLFLTDLVLVPVRFGCPPSPEDQAFTIPPIGEVLLGFIPVQFPHGAAVFPAGFENVAIPVDLAKDFLGQVPIDPVRLLTGPGNCGSIFRPGLLRFRV
jgi:hypothetical protein